MANRLELGENIGEQLALGETLTITNDAILDGSMAVEGFRRTSIDVPETDIEIFDQGSDSQGRHYISVYPLDKHNRPLGIVTPGSMELDDRTLRSIVSAAFSARARGHDATDEG